MRVWLDSLACAHLRTRCTRSLVSSMQQIRVQASMSWRPCCTHLSRSQGDAGAAGDEGKEGGFLAIKELLHHDLLPCTRPACRLGNRLLQAVPWG